MEVAPQMPIYTYECESCGDRFEAKQRFQDASLTVCSTCDGELHRMIQPVGIVFKGSGFYATDSRGKQNLATRATHKDEDTSSNGSDGAAASIMTQNSGTAAKSAAPATPAANRPSRDSTLPAAGYSADRSATN
jgi:putative FmdB family regulatory protein